MFYIHASVVDLYNKLSDTVKNIPEIDLNARSFKCEECGKCTTYVHITEAGKWVCFKCL